MGFMENERSRPKSGGFHVVAIETSTSGCRHGSSSQDSEGETDSTQAGQGER